MGAAESHSSNSQYESRGAVAKEIYSTEREYVSELRQLHDLYILPLKKGPALNVLNQQSSRVDSMFSNSEQLLDLHAAFLEVMLRTWDLDDFDAELDELEHTSKDNKVPFFLLCLRELLLRKFIIPLMTSGTQEGKSKSWQQGKRRRRR